MDQESAMEVDRKSTRLNSSHMSISYAVFCLKKERKQYPAPSRNPQPTGISSGTRLNSRPHPEGHDPRLYVAEHDRVLECFYAFFLMIRLPPKSTLFPYTTPFH